MGFYLGEWDKKKGTERFFYQSVPSVQCHPYSRYNSPSCMVQPQR